MVTSLPDHWQTDGDGDLSLPVRVGVPDPDQGSSAAHS